MVNVKIETKGRTARIYIDGQEVHGVIRYAISHEVCGRPVLDLTIACNLDISGDDWKVPVPEPWRHIGNNANEYAIPKDDTASTVSLAQAIMRGVKAAMKQDGGKPKCTT